MVILGIIEKYTLKTRSKVDIGIGIGIEIENLCRKLCRVPDRTQYTYSLHFVSTLKLLHLSSYT